MIHIIDFESTKRSTAGDAIQIQIRVDRVGYFEVSIKLMLLFSCFTKKKKKFFKNEGKDCLMANKTDLGLFYC